LHSKLGLRVNEWDEPALSSYDAIILVDAQPAFESNPLPEGLLPLAVDRPSPQRERPAAQVRVLRHSLGRGGPACTIVFNYFMELEEPISQRDWRRSCCSRSSRIWRGRGQPGELDNMALASLTLLPTRGSFTACRYVDLPQSYYTAYANGLQNAVYYDEALPVAPGEDRIPMEKPAIIADFLLRFDRVQWALVTAIAGNMLVLSLRTSSGNSRRPI